MLIDILGTSFQIKTDEDPEYFKSLIEYYSQKIEEIKQSSKTFDPLKIAILSGIIISDELFKIKNSENLSETNIKPNKEIDKIIYQMIDKIDKTLYDS